jgi:NAD(P)H dehydrogenase (quinone)
MRVLVIFAHPEPKSFVGALKDKTLEVMKELGHEVMLSDLYAMKFNPVLDREDFVTIANPDHFKPGIEQIEATKADGFAPDIKAEMEKLEKADLIVIHFPIYWFSVPAIVKGWFDRVLACGWAYGGGKWFSEGKFLGKKGILCFTTGGGPGMYSDEGIFGSPETLFAPIHHGVFNFTGIKPLEPFVAHSAAHVDAEGRTKYLEAWADRLRNIETSKELPFVDLADYDESFMKKKK